MHTPTFSGKRYFVTFIDEYSHYCVVYLLQNKSEVSTKFAQFVALAETQTGKRVRVLRSDNGGEYTSGILTKLCSDRGIVQKFTPPYTPQLNGVAERMNGDGRVPPLYLSANIPGGDEHNHALEEKYAGRIRRGT